MKCGQFSQPQATGGNSHPPSGNRFAAETDGSANLAISQLVYDSPYAKAHPGAPHKGEALLRRAALAVDNRRSRPGALAMQRPPLFLTGWTR